MSAERRFQTSYRETDTDEPGLVLEDDGTISQVKPDGTRVQIANGGSQPFTSPVVVQPSSSSEIATDSDHPLEEPSPIVVIAPATYASYVVFTTGLAFFAQAVTPGADGNAITLTIAHGGSSVVVDVVGTAITLTFPFPATTWGGIAAAWNASPEALALAEPTAVRPNDVCGADLGPAQFSSGFDAGPLARLRLAGNGASWYVRADGGVDIESVAGEFIGQIDINGAYFRGQPGKDSLTVVDSDYNNLIQANATGLGFNGATPAKPEIVASPDAQAVTDALVTLGLVTQAS